MSPGPIAQYASCSALTKDQDNSYSDRRLSAAVYPNMPRRRLSSTGGTDSNSSSSVDTSDLSEHERLQIESCFRGLKTQVFVCSSMANLYFGSAISDIPWELHYTGVPVILLDTGETRSRIKRRIQILLAERGTCFTLWHDTIDNLTSYKVSGPAFHTMCLSSDHTKLIGFSFDCVDAAKEMWEHVDRLTSSPENISLSVPGSRNKKVKKQQYQPLPEKSHISQPCCFQHITSVEAGDRMRYFSLQTLLPVLPDISSSPEHSPDEI
uniref:WH1 domain-containing protein n=1 Tax=Clastoptera arizonana TaxID=38151 RepID=A0A1B6CXN5_9HEMI